MGRKNDNRKDRRKSEQRKRRKYSEKNQSGKIRAAKKRWWELLGALLIVVFVILFGEQTGIFAEKAQELVTDQTDLSVQEDVLEVHFIDIGQGDATLIKQGSHAMLIDAGENDKGTAVQLYLQKHGVERLDYLILTHTDSDHIGGADVIISKYEIQTILLSDFPKENKTYRDVMDSMDAKGVDFTEPKVGDSYLLGNAKFTIIAPNRTYADPNNSSIALVLQHGENSFLFSGDAEAEAEEDILKNGMDLDVDVYKAGHHGSSSSSSEAFLDAMSAEAAVISCAADNSYGHPHAEVLNALRARKMKVYRTDEQGSIMATSDGTDIIWNCSPSDSWQSGERR